MRPLTPPWTPPELRVPSPSERRCSLPRPRHSAGRRPDGRVCPLAERRWLRRARARARRPIATSASEPLCEENSESRGHSHSVTGTLSHCEHKDKTDTRQYSTASRDRHSLRDQYSGIHIRSPRSSVASHVNKYILPLESCPLGDHWARLPCTQRLRATRGVDVGRAL